MEQLNWVEQGIFLSFLTVCAVRDAKKKSFPVWLLALGTLVPAVILAEKSFSQGAGIWLPPVLGALPGLGLYLAGRLFPGSVGSGDAWLMADTGLFLGWEKNLILWWIASTLAALAGGILLITGKGSRKTRLPMAPFVLAGYVLLGSGPL